MRALLACVSLCLLGACHREAPREGQRVFAPAPTQPTKTTVRTAVDAEGELLESDVSIVGLKIPRGLTETLVNERLREHRYETTVSIDKLVRYFDSRLVTNHIERVTGQRTTYYAASVRNVRGSAVKLDVSLTPVRGGKILIRINELPPPPPARAQPLTPAEHERMMREYFAHPS